MSSMIASALAIYSNLQSKDRQGFLSQPTTKAQTPPSSTPKIESSHFSTGSKPTTEKDTQ
jgi:hypothetical protein